jgi:hypothetical protein
LSATNGALAFVFHQLSAGSWPHKTPIRLPVQWRTSLKSTERHFTPALVAHPWLRPRYRYDQEIPVFGLMIRLANANEANM